MSEAKDKQKDNSDYIIKGFSAKTYLSQTGDFRWTPTAPTCNNIEKAEEFLEVLQKMPTDRRNVWTARLDTQQTLKTCPIIRKNPKLHKNFDQLTAAYNDQNPKNSNKQSGGEKGNE